MADDKAGGGGSSWGPLEIILVIILAIALLDTLTGRHTTLFPGANTPAGTTPVAQNPTKNGCGLTIESPVMNAPVGSAITIIGSVAGCNWKPTESVALYAQVIDAQGNPVSRYEAIAPSTAKADGSVTFVRTINLTNPPSSGKGTIIYIPAVPVPDRAVTIRMPVTFTGR